jgi:hypothetical protein
MLKIFLFLNIILITYAYSMKSLPQRAVLKVSPYKSSRPLSFELNEKNKVVTEEPSKSNPLEAITKAGLAGATILFPTLSHTYNY